MFLNIHRSGVLAALAWLVPLKLAAVSAQVLCTPYNCEPCHLMQNHMCCCCCCCYRMLRTCSTTTRSSGCPRRRRWIAATSGRQGGCWEGTRSGGTTPAASSASTGLRCRSSTCPWPIVTPWHTCTSEEEGGFFLPNLSQTRMEVVWPAV